MDLVNTSPFAAERFMSMSALGAETLIVVVKGTFETTNNAVKFADQQDAPRPADEYYGDPETSSIKSPSDVVPSKPGVDVLLSGHAYPAKPGETQTDVSLRVGTFEKVVRAFGPRRWEKSLGMYSIGKPSPFEKIPLKYELAFGGTDRSNPEAPEAYAPNPVGMGFRTKKSTLPIEGSLLPQLDDPKNPLKRYGDIVVPKAFGAISPGWEPRRTLAGTYDQKWLEDRMPLLPTDFQEKYHSSVPTDQILPHPLKGGEAVEILGATPDRVWRFQIPTLQPVIEVRVGEEDVALSTRCDTLVIDADRRLFTLTWRAVLDIHGRVDEVLWISVDQPGS